MERKYFVSSLSQASSPSFSCASSKAKSVPMNSGGKPME
jgi:hypothetical protein